MESNKLKENNLTEEKIEILSGFDLLRSRIIETLRDSFQQNNMDTKFIEESLSRVEQVIEENKQAYIAEFKSEFSNDELSKIDNYINKEVPEYMVRYSDVQSRINDEYSKRVLFSQKLKG